MANMKLTILGAGGVDENDSPLTDLSMTTGSDAVAGRCKLKVTYWTKASGGVWKKVDNEEELTFLLTLQYVEFRKQMYSPNSIEAYLLIKPLDTSTVKYKAFPSKSQLNTLFANRLVKLACDNSEVCNDYYVHEIIPRKYADQMYVTLKIFSPDKVMTLKKYCRTWTAKRLGSEILAGEIGNFSITRGGTPKSLESNTDNMKHIKSDGKEHIFPYLVQYNESFYDFLARTSNRWGEFLFYEEGKLQIGIDDTKVKSVGSYDVMSYSDWNTSQPAQANEGVCVNESPYDNNMLSSVVTEDGYDVVKNSVLQAFSPDNGADVYWMKKAGQLLTNNKSITNFVFDTAVDDFVAVAGTSAQVALRNAKKNDEYFKSKKTAHGALPTHDATPESKGAHYSTNTDNKETYNEFTEVKPILNETVYAQIVKGETEAGKNVVNIEFDTTWPDVKLGQVIKVDNESFVVIEIVAYQPEAAKKNSQSYYERGYNSKVVKYRVKAVAQVEGGSFYPPMLPTGHVRKSGPQIAVVVDVDDPLRANRVRVEYPWQLTGVMEAYNKKIDDKLKEALKDVTDQDKIKDITKEYESKKIKKYEKLTVDSLKEADVTTATPWLFYASASGPTKAGVHGRHYLAEKVMVDYSNGNVERPYVVGAVSTDIPVPLKTASAIMRAPNGEGIKVHEGMGNGAAAFIAGLTPGLKFVNSFVPFSFTPDNDVSRSFEGGVEMGDKYGIWCIKGSTDGRNVSISSPWGDVKIDAFTGITLSAPNGNIKIQGKNVTIEAGNNLTLTSGTNLKNKFASLYYGNKKFSALSWPADVAKAVLKKASTLATNLVDLSLLRSVMEVFWKPQEGTLTVQSNRYLKLSAGGSKAGFPDKIYKNPKKKSEEDFEKNKEATLNYGPVLAKLVSKISPIVDRMILDYIAMHKEYIKKTQAYDKAVEKLSKLSNQQGLEEHKDPCKKWGEALQDTVWTDNKEEITEADLAFDPIVADKSINDVNNDRLINIMNNMGDLMGRHKKGFVFKKKDGDEAKKVILTLRKEGKEKVLQAANDILTCVKKLQSLQPESVIRGTNYFLTELNDGIPENYIKMYQDAFKKDKCEGATFYTFINNHKKARAFSANDDPSKRSLALKRRIALNFVTDLGAESKAIKYKIDGDRVIEMGNDEPAAKPVKPATDAEFEGVKWKLYVKSLCIDKEINFFKTATSLKKSFLDTLKSNLMFFKPATEYNSWGSSKDGEILIGQGKNYHLAFTNDAVQIASFDPIGTSNGPLKRADLNAEDQQRFDNVMIPIRECLETLGGDVARVAQQNNVQVVNHNEQQGEQPVEQPVAGDNPELHG